MIELQYEKCQKLHRVLGALLKKNNKDMFTIDIKDGFFELQVIFKDLIGVKKWKT